MLFQQTKWKEISYREYCKLLRKFNKGKSYIEKILYDCPVRKELKQSIKEQLIPKGCGLLEWIRLETEITKDSYSIDSYVYYKNDGFEWVFQGGEIAGREFEKLYNLK